MEPTEETRVFYTNNSLTYNYRISKECIAQSINTIADVCGVENSRWHYDPVTHNPLPELNKGERIALMHSELSEALEGIRKDLMDDKLPHRKAVEVEFADLIIRVLHFAADYKMDVGGALVEKLLYNRNRADHSDTARASANGKRF